MTWPGPGTSRRWADGACPVCGQKCAGVHAERVVDLQPGGVPVADAYYTIPASACDDMGRLFRGEQLVARVGDRVPLVRAQEWGLAPEEDPTAAPGPVDPPSARRRASRNREKPQTGDR